MTRKRKAQKTDLGIYGDSPREQAQGAALEATAKRFEDAVKAAVAQEDGVRYTRLYDATTAFVIGPREAVDRVRKAVQYALYVQGVFMRETEPDSNVFLVGIS